MKRYIQEFLRNLNARHITLFSHLLLRLFLFLGLFIVFVVIFCDVLCFFFMCCNVVYALILHTGHAVANMVVLLKVF